MSNEGLVFLRKYEQEYWQTITTGIQFLPTGYLPDFLAAVQQVVIHDCTDGYLILRFAEREGVEFIVTHYRSIRWKDLLHEQKLWKITQGSGCQRLSLHTRFTKRNR